MRTYALMQLADKTLSYTKLAWKKLLYQRLMSYGTVSYRPLSYIRECAEQILRHAHGIVINTRQPFSVTDRLLRTLDQPFLSISERCLHISLLE